MLVATVLTANAKRHWSYALVSYQCLQTASSGWTNEGNARTVQVEGVVF